MDSKKGTYMWSDAVIDNIDRKVAEEELQLLRKELHDLMEDSGLQFLP